MMYPVKKETETVIEENETGDKLSIFLNDSCTRDGFHNDSNWSHPLPPKTFFFANDERFRLIILSVK